MTLTVGSQTVARRHRSFRLADSWITYPRRSVVRPCHGNGTGTLLAVLYAKPPVTWPTSALIQWSVSYSDLSLSWTIHCLLHYQQQWLLLTSDEGMATRSAMNISCYSQDCSLCVRLLASWTTSQSKSTCQNNSYSYTHVSYYQHASFSHSDLWTVWPLFHVQP